MTLALHGKSRERQWMLVIVGVLAILGAVMSAVALRGDAKADGPGVFNQTAMLPIADTTAQFVNECSGDPDRGPFPLATNPGTVWHFVATAGGSFTSLTGTFVNPNAVVDAVITDAGQNVGHHAWVLAPVGADLSAVTATMGGTGGTFTLSHICPGTPADPSVTVEKTHESTGGSTEPYGPGDTFDWVISITVDDGPTTGPVTISDTVDSRLDIDSFTALEIFSCAINGQDFECTLESGVATGVYTVRVHVIVDPEITQCGVVENIVTISGDDVEGGSDTDTDSVTVVCPQELDPSIEKTYDGEDGQSYSWTVEVTNPNDTPIDVRLEDPGAQLVTPSVCVETIGTHFDCTIPAGGATIELYTPFGQHDLCLPFTNTATIFIGDREVDTDSAQAPPVESDGCTQIPIEICKVWEDNGDNVDGASREFSFTVESQYVGSIEIPEDRSDCITVIIDYPDGSITVGEIIGDFENAPGYPKVIVESPGDAPQETTGETVALAFGNDPIGCLLLKVTDVALIQAQAIDDTPWCTITFINREPGVDSNVTLDKRHAPAGPFEPGDSFSWFIDVIVTGDPTTGATAIADSIPLPFIAGNFVIEAPITCDFASGALVQCSLPAGTAAGTYTIEVPVTVSPDLTGQLCTTYTNVAVITGYDVVGTEVPNGDIPTYTTSDSDGVIVECGNVAEDTFIEVIKLTFSQHNGGALVPTPDDDDGWLITVSSVNCGINQTKPTDANGHAAFDNLPICNDYVVSENVVNPQSPGYVPASPATVTGVTGGQTVTFTNVRRTFDPGCTNIADCGPTTSTPTTPTQVPTETPVPPTNTPTVEDPASPTNTPETAIAGERTPGAATPIAPSTGSGAGGSLATGMNLLLVLAGLLALSGGLVLAGAGRRG